MNDTGVIAADTATGSIPRGWSDLAERAVIEQEPLRARTLLYGVSLAVVCLIAWAAVGEVDEVTRGQGKVIPSRQVQILGSQDGGIIRELLVREGDKVERGALLLRLDETRSQASLGENRAELIGLSVRASRLQAVVEGTRFEPTTEMRAAAAASVEQEQSLFDSTLAEIQVQQEIARGQLAQRGEELSELKAREDQLDTERALAQQELDVTRPMVRSGAVSQVEILRLERELNRAVGELAQTRAQIKRVQASISEAEDRVRSVGLEYENDAREQLNETTIRINALRELGAGLSDRVQQTNVTAPVRGTVKQLFYNTVGGVVLPGRDIIELVPTDDTLLLEVRVRPQDIAFVAPGQLANVKVTAYDFVVYGGLEGRVETIGADTVLDENEDPYYQVTVRTNRVDFGPDNPIIPGMTVEVDVITGKKTVLSYLLKPVLRARQRALSEH
ncbi:MAG: HlyD family type I secretion periplasmic adaptor subunit [Pseudomonadota bacterium]